MFAAVHPTGPSKNPAGEAAAAKELDARAKKGTDEAEKKRWRDAAARARQFAEQAKEIAKQESAAKKKKRARAVSATKSGERESMEWG